MASVRQPKPTRKGPEPAPAARRAPAWTGARASPTFSPGAAPVRLPTSPANGAFPPLGANGAPAPAPASDRTLHSLAGLTGTTITLTTKTGQRWEGVVASTTPEGDTPGVALKDAKDLTAPGAPLKDRHFIASTNIDKWSSGPADAHPDSFKTDTDISRKPAGRERELQAWQPDAAPGAGAAPHGDDLTFGNGAAGANQTWDQFAANEKLFGVKAGFDEDAYTTKLDRNAPDFKEREREAQRIANEIMGSAANNPHIAEERNQNAADDSGLNEEDKYGAVVRGANAYVPPAARKAGDKPNGPKPDGVPTTSKSPPAGATPNKPPADPVPAFRDFMANEKVRLAQKRQAMVKNEMDKRMADLIKFSKSFKLNKPIPDDLVTILAKDEDKQKQIKEKSAQDAADTHARSIATVGQASITASPSQPLQTKALAKALPPGKADGTKAAAKPSAAEAKAEAAKAARISMYIQPIPAFKTKGGAPAKGTPPAAPGPTIPASSSSPLNAARLNVNASSFRPTPKSTPTPPGKSDTASPKPKHAEAQAPQQPNPFFGTRVIKKGALNIRDDFNPFKYNKVAEASAVGALWPYQGKRYMLMFPPIQAQPQQQSPHMAAPPVPPPTLPPPPYEEDPAQQAAARGGYVYAYPPYAYPGQPMMPGMPPPGPPGAYMHSPYMQPMGYPQPMPPNGQPMYAPMGQMPPPQAYMQPPPGAYPPPNGVARGSMPPTPIPAHAHAYYQPSPQLQHAMPYHMMMPPPGATPGPPHGYEQQVQMGGVQGHA